MAVLDNLYCQEKKVLTVMDVMADPHIRPWCIIMFLN